MERYFDYIMRRKPLLLLFLAVFLASGVFSYHVFIKSQTVIDEHVAETTAPNEVSEIANIETESLEVEIPHTGETEEGSDDSLISNGTNLENEDIGDTQASPELSVPHTGQAENSDSWTPPSVIVISLVVLAVVTVVFCSYLAAMHFLR